jgi:ribosomal protein L25 (general stress protein Ctc)
MESRALQCERRSLLRVLSQAGERSAVIITITGEKEPVAAGLGEIQWNPRSDQLLHVDFVRVGERT